MEPNRLGITLQEVAPEDAAQQIAVSVRERLAELEAEEPETSGAPLPRYPGLSDRSIWVVAENSRDGLAHVTYEMLGKARDLTAITRSEVVAVVISGNGEVHSQSLTAAGADRVLLLDNSSLRTSLQPRRRQRSRGRSGARNALRRPVRLYRRRPGPCRPPWRRG